MVYRNTTDFCVLILCPDDLLNSSTISSGFPVTTLRFSIYSIMLHSTVTVLLPPLQFGFVFCPPPPPPPPLPPTPPPPPPPPPSSSPSSLITMARTSKNYVK